MDSIISTEPIAATSDSTPQQARYAKLLSLTSEELNAMAVRYHRMGGHVRLRFAEVLLAIQETADLPSPLYPPKGTVEASAPAASSPTPARCATRPPPRWSTSASPGCAFPPRSPRGDGYPRPSHHHHRPRARRPLLVRCGGGEPGGRGGDRTGVGRLRQEAFLQGPEGPVRAQEEAQAPPGRRQGRVKVR